MNEPDPAPLPTRVRFAARHRAAPRQNPRVSVWIFFGLLLAITLAGYKGIAVITQFLAVMQQRQIRASEPEPIRVEFR